MVTQAPKRSAVAIAVLFVLSCLGLIIFVWGKFGGTLPLQPKGYRFHADFLQASQLVPNADVRIAGVNVGKVVDVQPRGLRADATIQLAPKFAPLPRDARAILRQKTLLGETFVALTPGTPGGPELREGGRLPTRNVAGTEQLDSVLGSFDTKAQRNLQRLLRGTATALDGRGQTINDALGNADPTLTSLSAVLDVLDRQSSDVRRVIRNTGTVLQTVADRRTDVTSLVRSGNAVLGATAARNRELTATVRALPPFLRELRSTMRVVDTTVTHAGPTLAALRPVAPLLRPALRQIITLAPQIQALMRQVGPLITAANRGLPAVTRVVSTTVPFIDELEKTGRQIRPGLDLIKPYGPTLASAFANIGATGQATTKASDGTTMHYLRILIPFTNESVSGTSSRPATNRHNAYPKPGVLDQIGRAGLPASDCRNASDNSTNVPCRLQGPLGVAGHDTYYPRLTPLPRP